MTGWAKQQKIAGSIITFLADARCELTEKLGLVLDHPGPMAVLGTKRCKRFAILAEDGIVKALEVSEGPNDPAGDDNPRSSCVENMLKKVRK